MTYVADQARQELLDTVADATGRLSAALAALTAAFDLLDDQTAERLEDELFRPLQGAYGRARRTANDFAARHRLPPVDFPAASPGHPSQGVAGFLEAAIESIEDADDVISELQDSMLPVEVGDPEVRAGLAELRTTLAGLPAAARRLGGLVGR
jgi:hypothetical protein